MKDSSFRRPAWPSLVLIGAVLAVSDPGFAQVVSPLSILRGESEELLSMNFRDAPLSVVLDSYADISGKTMIVSPKVPKVLITLNSKGKLSEPEFLYAIETLLALNNIALVPEGEELLNVVRRRR